MSSPLLQKYNTCPFEINRVMGTSECSGILEILLSIQNKKIDGSNHPLYDGQLRSSCGEEGLSTLQRH